MKSYHFVFQTLLKHNVVTNIWVVNPPTHPHTKKKKKRKTDTKKKTGKLMLGLTDTKKHVLQMKLEKKRSSSMDKIMNKLKSAQRKAQEMRSSATSNNGNQQLARTSHKVLSLHRTRQIGSLSGCFTCYAF